MNIISENMINSRNLDGRSALWFACSTGLRDVVILLLKKGASLMEDSDNYGQTLLHTACANNQGEMAIFLINNGSSPQGGGIFPDKNGYMPFDLFRYAVLNFRFIIPCY